MPSFTQYTLHTSPTPPCFQTYFSFLSFWLPPLNTSSFFSYFPFYLPSSSQHLFLLFIFSFLVFPMSYFFLVSPFPSSSNSSFFSLLHLLLSSLPLSRLFYLFHRFPYLRIFPLLLACITIRLFRPLYVSPCHSSFTSFVLPFTPFLFLLSLFLSFSPSPAHFLFPFSCLSCFLYFFLLCFLKTFFYLLRLSSLFPFSFSPFVL
jgi:hypothetical protein